jgi:hypothetical protein
MKRYIIVKMIALTALVFLAGCSTQQIKADVEAKLAHDFAVAVTPVASADLEAAAAQAASHGDTEAATCYHEVESYLGVLSTTPSGGLADSLAGIKGIATAIEAQRLAALAPIASIPPLPKSLITGCAVVVFDLKISMLEFMRQLGFDAANLRLGGAIGSAKTLSLVRAAEAAQAAKP